MPVLVAVGGDRAKGVGQRHHRAQTLVVRRLREGPRVAERHRPEAPGLLAVAGAHAALHVEDRDAIHRAAAEHVRRAIGVSLERVRDLDDADVGGAGRAHGSACCTPSAAPKAARERNGAMPAARAHRPSIRWRRDRRGGEERACAHYPRERRATPLEHEADAAVEDPAVERRPRADRPAAVGQAASGGSSGS